MGADLQEADKRKAGPDSTGRKSQEGVWETIKVVIQALLIAFVIRLFFFQPFNIPSGSMKPTLLVGDYLFVNKLSYGYGPYSFNFEVPRTGIKIGPMPFKGRYIFASIPDRGDVVVFKLPRDNNTDYIKRVIGLPGDRIQMRNGALYINDEPVKRELVEEKFVPDDPDERSSERGPVPQYRETLPNGVTYITLDSIPHSSTDNTREFEVPSDHYFMMGDNRDNSSDSRIDPISGGVGYVPYENLVGKATILFFSHRSSVRWWEVWRWPFAIRWTRFLNLVH